MGRTIAYRYSVRFRCAGNVVLTPHAWRIRSSANVKGLGFPNEENLRKFVMDLIKSFRPGGVNERAGEKVTIQRAEIIDHENDNAIVATWIHPPFLIVS